MIESGVDFKTFINQSLVDASLEIHNYLDMRYSTPLQKIKQTDIDTEGVSIEEEYDPIIIKSVCYIASANLIRAKEGASEEADYYYSLVTNPEKTGLLDKLNDGIYKLSFEVDANDKKGSIKYRNVAGTMDLVELAGEYSGEPYDLLKIEVEATGAYGVSTFKVHHFSDDKIFGDVTTPEIITGGLQHIYGGLSGRFQGASATDGDIWEVEVVSSHRKQTNKSNATIEMRR
jgi:phage gp36-like protein